MSVAQETSETVDNVAGAAGMSRRRLVISGIIVYTLAAVGAWTLGRNAGKLAAKPFVNK